MKAVVLISGGMDSLLCTAIANQENYEIAGLHLNYGQRTEQRELAAFNNICDFYGINERLCVDIGYLVQIGNSSLTDMRIEVSKSNISIDNKFEGIETVQNLSSENQTNEIPSSYVPFRNANLLAIATSWAETINGSAIIIGAIEQDSSGYPDCRKEFFEQMEKAINLGTKPETNIKIITPLINMSKKDIVLKSVELQAPLELSWSCYSESTIACGECDSCKLRLRGFLMAGIEDKIKYRKI